MIGHTRQVRLVLLLFGMLFLYLFIRDFLGYGITAFVAVEALLSIIYVCLYLEFSRLMRRIPKFIIGFLAINLLFWLWLFPIGFFEGNTKKLILNAIGLLGAGYAFIATLRTKRLPLNSELNAGK